ncbi:hypothetical protein A2673_03260 [Candidatus Kaiserbacteria bacterium RIFCSPHIGHO2_01_FULL_50_13]|uniref:Uncharacterized protein n=1 Tax=Candidatus Kaiserbacteria bacterium RIFCSPLOWO2_01_FULL_50_24 TaxID=1798507 RepID=A0A1F6EIQ2_9BACT|nr:MAG: hypothetical protein A2673_03260 [Candidatus Kaiserbacteria bacterium RIFCSPHIGHO2_01_FULL_50_13]OGG73523.1 MAG: hypothetical protein A3A34_01100 [Candidatus Kaiserbacteria bacterium RIFCSPLOWO2_01_FULL_50_24]
MDDDDNGVLVAFSEDGDGSIDFVKTYPAKSVLFCTGRGGGMSPCTRNALLILALAIKHDNEQKPQEGRKIGPGTEATVI